VRYEQSLQISQELGNKSGIASTLHGLGNIQFRQGNLAEAMRLYEQSLQIINSWVTKEASLTP
jgi:tetratricopeptide (TPR) repeat protein